MTNLSKVARRLRGRTNKIRGDHSEQVIAYRLKSAGLELVERVETGWRVQRLNGRIVGASPLAKVAADFTAIVPGSGRSVRVECKFRSDDVLSLSDFAPHQQNSLTLHAALGGISLVAWTTRGSVLILQWPIAGFTRGAPLKASGDPRVAAALWSGHAVL